MQLSVEYMRKSINENQLTYITVGAVNNRDYNKLNLIITLSTGFIPTNKDIFNLIESYDNDEKEYEEYEAKHWNNIQNDYINRGLGNIY